MRVSAEGSNVVLEEVFCGVLMRAPGDHLHEIGVCMRDGTFEINVCPAGRDTKNWWRVDMEAGTITPSRRS